MVGGVWDGFLRGRVLFALRVMFSPVEVSVLFLGTSSLSKELRFGVSSGAVHLGVDNLGVVRHVGRLLDGQSGTAPFKLVKDGDFLLLKEMMLHLRGLDTVRITKVKGHADEGMVLDDLVRELDRLGNDAAERLLTLDVGGLVILSLMLVVICLGFVVAGALFLLTFHRFFIATSRAVVNHDAPEGTAPDPLVCSAGAQEASARSCGSRPSILAWTSWYLGPWLGQCSCFCYLR